MKRIFLLLLVLVATAPGLAAGQSNETTPTASRTATPAPTLEDTAVEATLDEHAVVTGYQLNDGVMTVDVLLEEPTTISATERADTEGASNVRFEQWVHLDEGRHSLQVDTFSNQSATVLLYSNRGLEASGRAVQVQVDNTDPLVEGPFTGFHLLVMGTAVAVSFTFFVTWEALKARLGLGQGGERIA